MIKKDEVWMLRMVIAYSMAAVACGIGIGGVYLIAGLPMAMLFTAILLSVWALAIVPTKEAK